MELFIYKPKIEDLWFRQKLMEDKNTMSYNEKWGGIMAFPRECWESFYKNSILCDENKFFYGFLTTKKGEFVGDVGFRFDEERNKYIVHLLIFNDYRNRGYGTMGLKLICEKAKSIGIKVLHDDIAIDNPSVNLFLKNGFTKEYITEDYIMVKKIL